MSVTLSTISTQVDQFNDIPDITFTGIDITEFVEEVEIYTNTPAVMIPTKLNAMAANMKTWLNSNVTTPLENQQNTFKDEVVVRTNTAMNAVKTYMNDEVAGFVNSVFVPWANDAGAALGNASNLLESNVTTQMSQLQTDYTIHVQNQDLIIQQAIEDMVTELSQYTTGAADSGYSIHQTNLLVADYAMTREIGFDDYKYTKDGYISYAKEGDNTTHHISYDDSGNITSLGESLWVSGEVRPFQQHLKLERDETTGSFAVEKVRAYDLNKSVSATGVESFRVTGHEVDGSPAVDLTILNNTSIADVDNPELIIRRGSTNALMFGGIDNGDMVKISDLSDTLYNTGLRGQYAEEYDTTMFSPHSSYCHDKNSSVIGWGVLESDNASGIDSDGGLFETPEKCENYKIPTVSLLNDLNRSYETTIVGESYDGALSDGLTYNVSITDDSGVVDTYGYTIDANTTLGTGAIINAIYDNGVSDVTITDAGTKYSESTFARLFDLGAVSAAGSVETPATAVFTTKDGMIDAINVVDAGEGYQGYWNIVVPDGGNAHTHNLQLSQSEVNLIMSGTPVVSTTVDPNHSHDITISWNAFTEMFIFDSQVGAHDHGPVSSGHQINPSIAVTITGTGTNASAYVLLTETNTIDKVVMTNSGETYDASTSITLVGGLETTAGSFEPSFTQGGISTISMVDQGTGYTTNEPKTISVAIQNNSFSPAVISANVGDTISFTNLDLGAHTVTNVQGAFDSGDIPQNAVFTYTITQDTEITQEYQIMDSYSGSTATLWVRENTVFVDMVTVNGGGLRASGTVDAAGNLIDIAVTRPGKGYSVSDTVKIIDVSGPGEGAYATVETNRSINTITVENGGSGYSQETSVVVFDPTGTAILDEFGVETGRIYGSGAYVKPTIVDGEITEVAVSLSGENYVDVELIINDPMETGSGAVLTTDINNVVSNVNFIERGAGYAEPIIVITDPSGTVGTSVVNTVGRGFVGTVGLNNGIGGVTIVEDWHDYINGQVRIIVLDGHAEPTGYGATGTASLGGAGNISNVIIDNPGSAYKTPVIIAAGPVTYAGGSINAALTDYALFGPEGNTDMSPFSANGSAGTNFKNGVLVQWGSYQGHSLGDSWKFTCQSWKKGTPDSLVYESSRFNGSTNMMKGIITLKDIWEV